MEWMEWMGAWFSSCVDQWPWIEALLWCIYSWNDQGWEVLDGSECFSKNRRLLNPKLLFLLTLVLEPVKWTWIPSLVCIDTNILMPVGSSLHSSCLAISHSFNSLTVRSRIFFVILGNCIQAISLSLSFRLFHFHFHFHPILTLIPSPIILRCRSPHSITIKNYLLPLSPFSPLIHFLMPPLPVEALQQI